MVTVVKRPTGHKIIDQAITAEIIEDYSGDAWVLFPGHGLATGATVYIVSDIDEYNGFWYVTVTNGSSFKISEGVGTDFVLFYQEVDIEYYQTQEHDWSSVFLPIVYKVSNDKWPTNSVDSVNLIVLNSDDNGFTSLTLAAPFSANALEFLKITGASTDEANGVWQIVEVVTTNVIVINLPFAISGSLVGAAVQYYYNNYQVKVKIYAGLPSSHPWEPKKPYEEVAELSLTPDENNLVMFSISDYIKMKVAIKNNLTLFSLPLNLDAFTAFFIFTAESYDQSDNYSLYTQESAFEVDDFTGYAIAGKLPFKNVYAGDYADFVYTSGSPARWLTNRSRLLAVEGYYFDISFIKNIVGAFQVYIDKYISDYAIRETVVYADQGIGVYRIPITADANYDSFCVSIEVDDSPSSGGDEVAVGDFPAISTFTNSGTGDSWNTGGATPDVNVTVGTSKYLVSPSYTFQIGTTYKATIAYTKVHNSGSGVVHEIALRASVGPGGNVFQQLEDTTTGSTTGTVELTFTALNPAMDRINMEADDSSDVTITIDSFTITTVTPIVPGQTGGIVTEEICIDMLEACDVQDGFVTSEGIRLLEAGGYRLLE